METSYSGVSAGRPAHHRRGAAAVDWEALASSAELRTLVTHRRRYRRALNAVWVTAFVIYLLLMTAGQDVLGAALFGAINLSFLMVVFMQLLAFALVAAYAWKSNRVFEAMTNQAHQSFNRADTDTDRSEP